MLLRGIHDDRLLSPVDIAVSIYVPIFAGETDTRAPEDRVKNSFEEAAEIMCDRGVEKRARDAILDRARGTIGDLDFRERRPPSLAVFATEDYAQALACPITIPETTVVGHRFYIVPLLPLINANTSFFVLALSASGARLLECDDYGWTDRTPPHLPTGPEVRAETNYQPIREGNPAASHRKYVADATGAHSYEAPDELKKTELIEFIRRLSSALEGHLHDDRRPIVVIADPDIGGHFRKLTKLRQLTDHMVDLNPHGLGDERLVAEARRVRKSPEQAAIADFVDLANARLDRAEPTVAIRLEEIVGAAHYGQVDAVMVAAGETVWGHFDEGNATVVTHGTPNREDDELLNDIVAETLLNGGRAFSADRQKLPRQSFAVATLRYPTSGDQAER